MSTSVAQRRDTFITYLHGVQRGASSGIPRYQSECRQTLARLKRGVAGPRQQAEAYKVVFAHEPPESEQDVWILVAGLFALHPLPSRNGDRSLGTSLRILAKDREASATRRFEQLMGRDRDTLPHHLRQIVRLLASDGIPVNYSRLLDDLVVLMGAEHQSTTAQRVRLRWARDFHRPDTTTKATPGATESAPSNENTEKHQ